MGLTYSQMFPPKASFTKSNIPDLTDKVFIVTGGYTGVGYHVSEILYRAGGKVYIAGRTKSKAEAAIQKIQESSSSSTSKRGSLHYLAVDLSDLSTIKRTVQEFQAHESKLHVLFNNAGVSLPPAGSRSAQNHELQMATNCLGHFLLTNLLIPQLQAAATESGTPPGSVRVVWTSSQVVELAAPTGGFKPEDLTTIPSDQNRNYTNSKTGNWYLASEFSRRIARQHGILSLTNNPGALKTELLRNAPALLRLVVSPLLHPAVNGAYTELYAGLSPEVTLSKDAGGYVIPWGRMHPGLRKDLELSVKSKGEDGGTGMAEMFWDWCDEQTKDFM